jgi:hypothetical protein
MSHANRLESLEKRRLMSVSLAVNFQPDDRGTPDWMERDSGELFADRGDYSFGWSRDLSANAVERNSPFASWMGRDTLVTFGPSDRWDIQVPVGSYRVYLVAGDPTNTDASYAIDLEGKPALRGEASDDRRYVTTTTTVEVTDGRLSLTSGAGARKNAIALLEIEQIDTGADDLIGPSTAAVSDITDSSVRLTWSGGARNHTGFRIEQLVGSSWTTIDTVGRNVNSIVVDNLDPETAYSFRVRAFRSGEVSDPSSSVRATTLEDATVDPIGYDYFDGVTVAGNNPVEKVDPILSPLGVKAVRIWSDFDYDRFEEHHSYEVARKYKAAGYHVTLLLQEKSVPTPAQARAFFQYVVDLPGMKNAVDRWEIINEANLGLYFQGSLSQYVTNVLKPAYEVLSAEGEKVVGTGVAFDTNAAKRLRDLGYLDYVDYANFHPYGPNAATHIAGLKKVVEIFKGKPLTLTEWNITAPSTTTTEQWVRELNTMRTFVKANVESAFYFNIVTYKTRYEWRAGLATRDASDNYIPTAGFYEMYQSWS